MFTPCLVFGANPSTEEKSNVTVSCKLQVQFRCDFHGTGDLLGGCQLDFVLFGGIGERLGGFQSNAKDDEGVERTLKSASDIAKEETTPLTATFFLLSSLPSSSMRVDEDVNDVVFDISHPLFTRLFATHRLP